MYNFKIYKSHEFKILVVWHLSGGIWQQIKSNPYKSISWLGELCHLLKRLFYFGDFRLCTTVGQESYQEDTQSSWRWMHRGEPGSQKQWDVCEEWIRHRK